MYEETENTGRRLPQGAATWLIPPIPIQKSPKERQPRSNLSSH